MGNQNSTNTSAPAKVLVLSHQHYNKRSCGYQPEERNGNEKDVERLETLFEQRKIPALIHKNFTKNETLLTLKYFCETDVNESCMAIIIMTHGGKHGELEAKDEAYNTRDVYDALCKCKDAKLKLIFFVACRGNGIEKLMRVETGATTLRMEQQRLAENDIAPFTENQSSLGSLTLNEPDFLVVYCTEEDRKGYRDDKGTWYVQTLCDVLDNMQEPEDIWSILTRVTNLVSKKDGKDDDGREVAQTPCVDASVIPHFIIDPPSATQQSSDESPASGPKFSSVDPNESSQPNSTDVLEVLPEEVHCLMYNSSVYCREAERVTQTIRKIGFEPQKFTEFSQLLNCIEQGSGPGNKECLFVVIIAQLKKGDLDESYQIMVDDTGNSSVKYAWEPSRRNSNFIGKPKVFFFLDPFKDEELLPTTGMQSDGSLNQRVPEHFNILRLLGFGIDFMEKLCLALENWPHNPDQRIEIMKRDLSRVIRRAAYESRKPKKGCTINIQTTLGVKLKLIGPKLSNDIIMEEIEGPTECYFIVGKERKKIECDAASHDDCHTILNHTSSQNGAKRTRIETELPHIEHGAFSILQTYKRDNTLPEILTYEDACDVVAASQTYRNIPGELVQHCRDFIINDSNTPYRVCAGLNFAVTAGDTHMLDFFLQKIRSDISAILQSVNIATLSTESLIKILQEDQLNCTEMELFQACVRWCEQQPDFISDNLRSFMEPFIAHIRFLTMSHPELMSLQICEVLSDAEIGAIAKKMFGSECGNWPKTISINKLSRMSID